MARLPAVHSAAGTVARALVLGLASLALGAAVNLARPRPLPWVEDWSRRIEKQALALGLRAADAAQVRELIDEGGFFLFDARPEAQYRAGHLPGALPLPSEAFAERVVDYLGMLAPEQEILVYCSGWVCDESLNVCRGLLELGSTNLVLFAGGVEAWTEAGYPLEEGP